MRGYTPIIDVQVGGVAAGPGFYGRLLRATIRDEEGQTSDTLTVDLDDRDNEIELPEKGARLAVSLGYAETGLVSMGEFEVQSFSLKGGERGETVTLQAKSASLRKGEKAGGRESFEGKTLGEIVRELAKRDGLEAVVDEALASIQIPYLARVGQSALDTITRLADRHDGIAKRAGRKIVVAKRGAGKSASGKAVPPILIRLDGDHVVEWEITSDPRPRYGKVKAAWIDQKTGKREVEEAETGFDDGPDHPLRHPFPSKAEAKKAAEAEAGRLSRNTGSGHFTLYGRPEAGAGAVVQASGFRDGVDGEWRANAVEHEFEGGAGGGYRTKVDVKAPERGKKES